MDIARQHQPHSAIVADSLDLPHGLHRFDFVISIAVIHHLSTVSRRIAAIRAIIDSLQPPSRATPGGKAFFYVWALEQRSSRRGWDEGDSQDVMVPWVLKANPGKPTHEKDRTFERYYHLYHEGELEDDIIAAGGRILESGYEKDNWWAIAQPRAGP